MLIQLVFVEQYSAVLRSYGIRTAEHIYNVSVTAAESRVLTLTCLCSKILDDEAAQELMPVVAGAVFTLTAHLSQAVRTEQKQPLASGLGESHYAFLLEGSITSPTPAENPVVDFTSIGDSSLHIILKKLLDFILKTGPFI